MADDARLEYGTFEVDVFLGAAVPIEALERFNRIMRSIEQHGLTAEARPDWNGTIVVGEARALSAIDAAELVIRTSREAGIVAGIHAHPDATDQILVRRTQVPGGTSDGPPRPPRSADRTH